MNYSKYSDISSLLIELCQPFSKDERACLTKIGAKMASDAAFDRAYTLEVKNYYLKSLPALNDGSYTPVSFDELNSRICQKISEREQPPAVLLPEYTSISYEDKSKGCIRAKKMEELKERILKLRQKNRR